MDALILLATLTIASIIGWFDGKPKHTETDNLWTKEK